MVLLIMLRILNTEFVKILLTLIPLLQQGTVIT